MGGTRRPRLLLSYRCAHGLASQHHLQPHLDAGAGTGSPLPAEPARPHVPRNHRLESAEGRPERQEGESLAVSGAHRGLRRSQLGASRARGREVRHSHAFEGRRRGGVSGAGPAADQPRFHGAVRQDRLLRRRRRHQRRGRMHPHRAGAGQQERDDSAQPRPADLRPDRGRRLQPDAPAGARLRNADHRGGSPTGLRLAAGWGKPKTGPPTGG